MNGKKEWLSTEETVAEFGRTKDYWQDRAKAGEIYGKKNGRWMLWRPSIEAFMRGEPRPTPPNATPAEESLEVKAQADAKQIAIDKEIEARAKAGFTEIEEFVAGKAKLAEDKIALEEANRELEQRKIEVSKKETELSAKQSALDARESALNTLALSQDETDKLLEKKAETLREWEGNLTVAQRLTEKEEEERKSVKYRLELHYDTVKTNLEDMATIVYKCGWKKAIAGNGKYEGIDKEILRYDELYKQDAEINQGEYMGWLADICKWFNGKAVYIANHPKPKVYKEDRVNDIVDRLELIWGIFPEVKPEGMPEGELNEVGG